MTFEKKTTWARARELQKDLADLHKQAYKDGEPELGKVLRQAIRVFDTSEFKALSGENSHR